MKRISILLLAMTLAVTPMFALSVCADTNGRDSSSQSMSAGADSVVSEPEEAAAEEGGENPIDGDLSEAADEIEVEDASDEDIAAEAKAQAAEERAPIVRTVITIAIALCALGAAILLLRSKRKDDYKSKH